MLPIIDVTALRNGPSRMRDQLDRQIAQACQDTGFFHITNHGVPIDLMRAVRSVAEDFFAPPPDNKLAIARRPGTYRGHIPMTVFAEIGPNEPPLEYEAFLAGREIETQDPEIATTGGTMVPNLWPNKPSGFREIVMDCQNQLRELSEHLLAAFARALLPNERPEIAAGKLLQHFTRPISNISLLHYPPHPGTSVAIPEDIGAHHDTNALTFLLPGEVGGLEARNADGRWMQVEGQKDCFVVNIGNMMECWSGGRFKSTIHRVRPPAGVDRFSIAYFAVPNHETRVRPLSAEAGADFPSIHAGEDLLRFISQFDVPTPT